MLKCDKPIVGVWLWMTNVWVGAY